MCLASTLVLTIGNSIKTSSPLPTFAALRFRSGLSKIRMAMDPKLVALSRGSSSTVGCGACEGGRVGVEEGGIASKFWLKFCREAVFAKYTGFVVGVASGELNISTYRHYILQDFHFLKAFAHAYELAYECTDDDDAKEAISELRKGVIDELKLHNTVTKEFGVDLNEENINAATTKYTDFLLATATGKVEGVKSLGKLATPFERTKVAAYTLGAMTPCMRLYAFIGKELQPFLSPHENHAYKQWIHTYSSDAFQASALQTEDLLDKLSVSLTGEELDVIEHLYRQAMKLEIAFFNAHPLDPPAVVPLTKQHDPGADQLIIYSDFDLTCTVVDSSAILAEIAIITAPKNDLVLGDGPNARMSSADLRNTWGLLSKKYTEDYEHCIESILRHDKVEEFNYESLCKALEPLSEFERVANARVVESGVLKGLNFEDIRKAGEKLHLQSGCASFFQKILKNEQLNASVHVLSYCWCADLIRSSFFSEGLDTLEIHANDLAYDRAISTGEIVKKVESPADKIEAFQSNLKNYSGKRNVTVYIGDSVGDLLCLLQADIGIVIGTSSSLRRIGTQFGVSFVPLFSGLVGKQKEIGKGGSPGWKGLSGVLYTVSCWAEIDAFIVGW